jgi:hypothetical protein
MANHQSRDDIENMPGGDAGDAGDAWDGGTVQKIRKAGEQADTVGFVKDLVSGTVERAMSLSEANAREKAKKLAVRKAKNNVITRFMQLKAKTLAAAKAPNNTLDLKLSCEHVVAAENALKEAAHLFGVARDHGFDASRNKFVSEQHAIAAIAVKGARELVDGRFKTEKAAHAIYELMNDVDQQIQGDGNLDLDPWSFVKVRRRKCPRVSLCI